jgi:Rad3-related DNA helicase
MQLKQGVGRLLRTEDDRGVVAVLDDRVLTRPYGRPSWRAAARTAAAERRERRRVPRRR